MVALIRIDASPEALMIGLVQKNQSKSMDQLLLLLSALRALPISDMHSSCDFLILTGGAVPLKITSSS